MFAPTLEISAENYTTQPAPTEISQRADNWLITVRELFLPLRLYTFPHSERFIQQIGQNNTVGYVYCEKSPYKQVVWNCFCMKQGSTFWTSLPYRAHTNTCNVWKMGSMGKAPFGKSEERNLQTAANMSWLISRSLATPSVTMQQHAPYPSTQVHSIRLLVFLLSLHVPGYNQHTEGDPFFPRDREPQNATGEGGIHACHSWWIHGAS